MDVVVLRLERDSMMKQLAFGALILTAVWGNTQPLSEAINFPGLELSPSGNASWFIQETDTYDGISALQSGDISDSQSSTISAQVEGPGTLVFYWKVESEGPDYFRFFVDNIQVSRISGRRDWQRYEIVLEEPRTYGIAWTYNKDGSVSIGRDAAWLDAVSFGNLEVSSTRQKISHENQSFNVEVTGDGSWAAASSIEWATVQPPFGEGPGSVTVTTTLNEGVWRRVDLSIAGHTIVLDQEAELSSGNAVNNDEVWLKPVMNGQPMWFTQTEETHDGVDALQSGDLGNNGWAAVQAEVNGPGILSFWWKVESEGPDYLRFKLDGEVQNSISGINRPWALMTYELPEERTYELEWIYQKDSSVSQARDAAWLDEVSFGTFEISEDRSNHSFEAQTHTVELTGEGSWSVTENLDWVTASPSQGSGSAEITFTLTENTDRLRRADIYIGGLHHVLTQDVQLSTADAINNPVVQLTPVVNGYPLWFTQSEESHDGVDALQSGDLSNSGWAAVQAEVTGPGTLSFWWKVDSEGPDYLRFKLDGEVQNSISGLNRPWSLMTYELPEARTYQLEWIYQKDSSVSQGSDAAWLDEVSFGTFNVQPLTIKAPHNASSQIIQVSGAGSWSGKEISDFAVLESDTGVNDGAVVINLPLNEGDWRYTEISVAGKIVLLDQEGALTTNEAVDNPAIRLSPVIGTASWKTEPTGGVEDGSVLRSGQIRDNGISSMETWVYGPGEFSFYWRTDSEGSDRLSLRVDGTPMGNISGPGRAWAPMTIQLEDGRLYHVEWRYAKDGSIGQGADAGYVDRIVTPNSQLDWAARYFTGEELMNPQISGPDADPDMDGVPNRIERELNLNPVNSNSTVNMSIVRSMEGSMSLQVQPILPSIPFHIERTSNWIAWEPVSNSLINMDNDMATMLLTDSTTGSMFFRLIWSE